MNTSSNKTFLKYMLCFISLQSYSHNIMTNEAISLLQSYKSNVLISSKEQASVPLEHNLNDQSTANNPKILDWTQIVSNEEDKNIPLILLTKALYDNDKLMAQIYLSHCSPKPIDKFNPKYYYDMADEKYDDITMQEIKNYTHDLQHYIQYQQAKAQWNEIDKIYNKTDILDAEKAKQTLEYLQTQQQNDDLIALFFVLQNWNQFYHKQAIELMLHAGFIKDIKEDKAIKHPILTEISKRFSDLLKIEQLGQDYAQAEKNGVTDTNTNLWITEKKKLEQENIWYTKPLLQEELDETLKAKKINKYIIYNQWYLPHTQHNPASAYNLYTTTNPALTIEKAIAHDLLYHFWNGNKLYKDKPAIYDNTHTTMREIPTQFAIDVFKNYFTMKYYPFIDQNEEYYAKNFWRMVYIKLRKNNHAFDTIDTQETALEKLKFDLLIQHTDIEKLKNNPNPINLPIKDYLINLQTSAKGTDPNKPHKTPYIKKLQTRLTQTNDQYTKLLIHLLILSEYKKSSQTCNKDAQVLVDKLMQNNELKAKLLADDIQNDTQNYNALLTAEQKDEKKKRKEYKEIIEYIAKDLLKKTIANPTPEQVSEYILQNPTTIWESLTSYSVGLGPEELLLQKTIFQQYILIQKSASTTLAHLSQIVNSISFILPNGINAQILALFQTTGQFLNTITAGLSGLLPSLAWGCTQLLISAILKGLLALAVIVVGIPCCI